MINYRLLDESIHFYEDMGFKRIESPWLVTNEINNITCPLHLQDGKYFVTKKGETKTFVASGEQSFLYLINKGFLPAGKYQTITPCMRNDPFDQWHTKYFLKNELIYHTESAIPDRVVDEFCFIALDFFQSQVPQSQHAFLRKVDTNDGYDIEFHGVEIGSYGKRKCEFTEWVYGTGIAEPRFSRILNSKMEKVNG